MKTLFYIYLPPEWFWNIQYITSIHQYSVYYVLDFFVVVSTVCREMFRIHFFFLLDLLYRSSSWFMSRRLTMRYVIDFLLEPRTHAPTINVQKSSLEDRDHDGTSSQEYSLLGTWHKPIGTVSVVRKRAVHSFPRCLIT